MQQASADQQECTQCNLARAHHRLCLPHVRIQLPRLGPPLLCKARGRQGRRVSRRCKGRCVGRWPGNGLSGAARPAAPRCQRPITAPLTCRKHGEALYLAAELRALGAVLILVTFEEGRGLRSCHCDAGAGCCGGRPRRGRLIGGPRARVGVVAQEQRLLVGWLQESLGGGGNGRGSQEMRSSAAAACAVPALVGRQDARACSSLGSHLNF